MGDGEGWCDGDGEGWGGVTVMRSEVVMAVEMLLIMTTPIINGL